MQSEAQVTVTTAATLLVGAQAGRVQAIVENTGAAAVFLGDASVTASTGYSLAALGVLPVLLDLTDVLYAITATGTQPVSVLVVPLAAPIV